MEQLAPADGIALSEHTQKAVDGFFELRSLGPAQVKGSSQPVGVSVLEGIGSHRTRLDTARARGLSRFVGRRDEIATLGSALEHALEGTGRVAAVVGEAGVGKSRLCAEFVESCRARGLAVYEAHCPAHGKTIPYLPLLELLRNLFGIEEQDGPREARQKVAGELALLDDGFADDRALVLDFLGVADPKAPPLQLEPTVRQRRLFAFLRQLLQLRTQAEPIVLLIDDLHWIDPGSDLFVAQIVEAVSASSTLLLVNFRPEYQAEWTRKSWVLQLPMAPLDADALAELVRDWVGSSPSVTSLPAMIGERSGGNPFFAEEIVLTLLETGRLVGSRGACELVESESGLEVPATVQALLAARIDRLGDREKELLYAAAVIGKEFQRPLLEAVIDSRGDEVDGTLASLLAAELIYERAIYPVAEYAFKHPLTHEVALGAQLRSARQSRHAAVAEAIEAAHPDRLDEQAGLLAHHWTEAGEASRAGTWHVRAASWVRTSDLAASRRHWSLARELLVSVPDSPERSRLLLDVYPELINTLDQLGADRAEAEAVYREGIALAQHAGEPGAEGLIEAANCWLAQGQNDWSVVVGHGERAVELADLAGDQTTRLFARFTLGRARGWLGVWQSSVDCFDEALEIGGGDDAAELEVSGWRPYVESLSIRSAVLSVMGRPKDGLVFAERLPALQRRLGLHANLSSASCDRIWLCFTLGDAERARRYTTEARRETERFGSDRLIVYALWASSVASCLGFAWQEGDEFIERARKRVAAAGTGREWATHFDAFQALCAAGLNDQERAAALARKGVESARANPLVKLPWVMGSVVRSRVLRMLGEAHQDELEAQCTEALELVSDGADGWLPMVLAERAGLARMRGDDEAMTRDLAEARRRWEQMGASGWIEYSRTIEG
jgi:adenylate cyclase